MTTQLFNRLTDTTNVSKTSQSDSKCDLKNTGLIRISLVLFSVRFRLSLGMGIYSENNKITKKLGGNGRTCCFDQSYNTLYSSGIRSDCLLLCNLSFTSVCRFKY